MYAAPGGCMQHFTDAIAHLFPALPARRHRQASRCAPQLRHRLQGWVRAAGSDGNESHVRGETPKHPLQASLLAYMLTVPSPSPNSRLHPAGTLSCLDGYMNIAMEETSEWVGGVEKNRYGDAFIRGNNVLVSTSWAHRSGCHGPSVSISGGRLLTDTHTHLRNAPFPSTFAVHHGSVGLGLGLGLGLGRNASLVTELEGG